MRLRRLVVVIVAAVIVAAIGLAIYSWRQKPPPKLTLKQSAFGDLVGWGDDKTAAALRSFLKSCAVIAVRADGEALDPSAKSADFGTVGDWRGLCSTAAALAPTDAAARAFFEENFTPLLAGNNGASEGLFTGYYEIALNGSRHRKGPYQTPIYRRPPNPKAYSRGQIDDGALSDKGLELFWINDPIGAYFLEIQGSGVIHLKNGAAIRVGYDGSNGQAYVPIGRLLVERSEVPLKDMTMATLRDWIVSHGAAGKALMRENPSYVFFKEIAGDGPLGSENVVLTAQRSLAVDRRFIPLGTPLWLNATQRFGTGMIRQLVIAQDTGGAIKGPVRGDLYWGSGDAAGREAGATNATGHYYLLVPKMVVARALASVGGN